MAEPSLEKEIEGAYVVPDGWIWCKLGEVCENNPKSTNLSDFDQSLPTTFVPMTAVDQIEGTIKTPEILPLGKARKGHTQFIENDVIFARITPCMENGKAAIAKNLENGLGFGSTEFHVIRPPDEILPEYIFYFIRQVSFRNKASAHFTSTVGQMRVPKAFMLAASFPFPPLNEQHRIVAKLETLLAQVNRSKDHLVNVPPLIKRFRQSVLAAACSGRLTEDWRREHPDVEPASELLNRIREERIQRYEEECRKAEAEGRRKPKKPKNIELKKYETNEMNGVPINWAFVNLDFISTKVTDGEHLRPNVTPKGIPFLSAKDVRDDGISFENPLYVSKADSMKFGARCNPEKGDILIVSRGATVGRTCIVNTAKEFCLLGSVILIKVVYLVLSKYVLFTVKSLEVQKKLDDMSGSTAQQAIYLKDVKKLDFFLPPLSEQHEIAKRVETLFHFADEVEQRVAAATTHTNYLTQSLLARAFRGELVPQDPSDEPASVLLERIKQARAELKAKKMQKGISKTMLDFN